MPEENKTKKLYGNLGCKQEDIWDSGGLSIYFQTPFSTSHIHPTPNTEIITFISHTMSNPALPILVYIFLFIH